MPRQIQIFTREGEIFFCVGIERHFYKEVGITANLHSNGDSQTSSQHVVDDSRSFGLVDFVTQTLRSIAWCIDNHEEAIEIYLKFHPKEEEKT